MRTLCPGRFPDDERLDIVQTTYSPGVRRLMARAGSQSQFEQAAEDLRCYAGLTVEAREIERVAEEVGRQVEQWLAAEQKRIVQAAHTPAPAPASDTKFYVSFDGTGVPVRPSELVGRRGKQAWLGPYPGSQAGLRVHPSGLGPRGLSTT